MKPITSILLCMFGEELTFQRQVVNLKTIKFQIKRGILMYKKVIIVLTNISVDSTNVQAVTFAKYVLFGQFELFGKVAPLLEYERGTA